MPSSSCHPLNCKLGVVNSEVERTFRNCSNKSEIVNKHVDFFVNKFCNRGYDKATVQRLVKSKLASLRQPNTPSRNFVHKFFLHIKFSSSCNSGIQGNLRRHQGVLKHIFQKPTKLGIAFHAQRNLFRLHYANNWLHGRGGRVRDRGFSNHVR